MVYGREKTSNFIQNCFRDSVICGFFFQKPYYKLQLALNYWKTCIPVGKEKKGRKEG